MNQPPRTLIIEIRTVGEANFDPSQTSNLTIYQDSANNYYLATSIKQIQQAILDAVPQLGSNHRHPLYFDVQVLPGDKLDALVASIGNARSPGRRRRYRGRSRVSN